MYLIYSVPKVPAILNEAIPSATRAVDESLNTCHKLAHQYTALLESMQEDQHRYTQLSSFKLKEALFNVRQYEAFLCILLVRYHHVISCGFLFQIECIQVTYLYRTEI